MLGEMDLSMGFCPQGKRENHHVATALRGDTDEAAANPEPWRQGSKGLDGTWHSLNQVSTLGSKCYVLEGDADGEGRWDWFR